MIVSVKNERNLASLTVYGDIEGQEFTHMEANSSEMYITPGVVNIVSCSFFSLSNLIERINIYFILRLAYLGKMKGQKK